MTDLMLETAIRERNKLKAEMEKSPIYRQLQAVENVIAAYGGITSAEPRSKGQQILALSKACIQEKGGHAKMAVIHQYLQGHGVTVGKPALSAYLSGFDELVADRSKGWSVKDGEYTPGT